MIRKTNPPHLSREGWLKRLVVFATLMGSVLFGQVPAGTEITNQARGSYLFGIDSFAVASTNTVDVTVTEGYYLHFSKQADVNVVLPGDTLTYRITMTNSGNITTPTYAIVDTLPDHLTTVLTDPTGSIQGQVITWNMAGLAAGATQQFIIKTVVDGNAPSDIHLGNTAWVHLDDGVDLATNETQVLIGEAPDLKLALSVDDSVAMPGDTLNYRLMVRNTGNTFSTGTILRDVLSTEVEFLAASGNGSLSGQTVTWDLADIAPLDSTVLTVQARVADTVPPNTEALNLANVTNDQSITANAQVSTFLYPWTLPITKTAAAGAYGFGDSVVFEIGLDNISLENIQDVVVLDTLPEPLQFLSASHGGEEIEGVVTWTLGTLAAQSSKTLEVVTRVGSLEEATPEIINTAIVHTANSGSNRASHSVSLDAYPELVLNKIAPASLAATDTLVYTLTLRNDGVTRATEVALVDSLPTGLEFASATGTHSYDPETHAVTWDLDVLGSGAQQSITLKTVVTIPVVNGTVMRNQAYATNLEGQYAVDSTATTVQSAPIFELSVDHDALTVPSDTLTYTVFYTNLGTETANHTNLAGILPEMLAYVDSERSDIYDEDNHQLTWPLDELAPGDSGTVAFRGVVHGDAPRGTWLEAGFELTCSEGVQVDASARTLVRAPEIILTLEADTNLVSAGDVFDYLITFANVGDTTATNVFLVDSLPELTYYRGSSAGGVYDSVSHTITWELGDLEPETDGVIGLSTSGKFSERRLMARPMASDQPEQPYHATVEVHDPIANGVELITTVSITSSESGVASAAVAAATTPVQSAPVLTLTKQAAIEAFPGDTVQYVLTYGNIGSDIATGVTLVDTMDSRVELLDISGVYSYDEGSGLISWDLGDLEVGATGTETISVVIPNNLEDGDHVRNRAWLTSNELAPLMAEAYTTNILPMSVNLTANPGFILGNGEASSTLRAQVLSYLGNPAPAGIPVTFTSDAGTIPDSVVTLETNADGIAFSTLVSDTVLNQPVTAIPLARAIYSDTKWADDTTQVTFLIGAFDGHIYDYNGIAQEDVVIRLQSMTTGAFRGRDTTNVEGYYFIPIFVDDFYQITYTLYDANGNPYETVQEMEINAPDSGEVVTNLNSVSGWIYDGNTGEIIPEDSILIILEGTDTDTTGLGRITSSAGYSDSTYTDTTGKFFFTNLQSGQYRLTADYNGIKSYSDGLLDVNLSMPGLYMVSANVQLRQSPYYLWKTVDQPEAKSGDTLDYTLHFGAIVSPQNPITLVDELPQGIEPIDSTIQLPPGLVYEGYDPVAHEMRFSRNMLSAGDSLELRFQALVTGMAGVRSLRNDAWLADEADTTLSVNDSRSRSTTKIIFPFLQISKKANRGVIEVGDVLTYTVQVTNTSPDDIVRNFTFDDLMPRGFKYRRGSTRLDGEKRPDPQILDAGNRRQALVWSFPDTLGAGETMELKYRVIAGTSTREGINVNEVYAHAFTLRGYPVQSDVAEEDVIVRPGILSDRGLIIGKVYFDQNANGIHDHAEPPATGVELIMETGARITVDEYGKFSVPDIASGMHVMRINERTLPPMAEVIEDSPDYLGDVRSRIVRVGAGGMAKVSIALREAAIPAVVMGTVYYDMNENAILDDDEDVVDAARLFLSDSMISRTDLDGRFLFKDLPLGTHTLSLDMTSLPGYARLRKDLVDSLQVESNLWRFDLGSEDTLVINLPLTKHDLYSALSKEATLEMHTEMITKEFRLMVYKPWVYELRFGFKSGTAELRSEVVDDLRNAARLLEWQDHLNLEIQGHTDNIPVTRSGYRDNLELSQARATAVREWMINEGNIDPDRIIAVGFGDALPLASNDTDEGRAMNRRVDLIFQSKKVDDDLNQLAFAYDIKYSGEVAVDSVRFHQLLPPGFVYKEETADLNNKNIEPEAIAEGWDKWEFNDWDGETHDRFKVAMKPNDFKKVQNTGIVSAYLEFVDEDGLTIQTDSLQTKITTVVNELSFNLILEGTQFSSGSADLRASALPALRKLGQYLAWAPDVTIVIEGFTDNMGSVEYNMMLSEWRANSVKQFIMDNFPVKEENIFTVGHGPRFPVGDNNTRLGRQANRRVEVLVNAKVGEVATLETETLKASLLQTVTRPPDPFGSEVDSVLVLPGDQASNMIVNLQFPAFAGADSIVIDVTLLEELYFAEGQATTQRWEHRVNPENDTFAQPMMVMVPSGVKGIQEMLLSVQLYKDGESVSGVIQKPMQVNIE